MAMFFNTLGQMEADLFCCSRISIGLGQLFSLHSQQGREIDGVFLCKITQGCVGFIVNFNLKRMQCEAPFYKTIQCNIMT